jgi:glycosyltransferase involved in cell wall biosynthesis
MDKMTKVLFIIPWLKTGGSETYVLNLVKHLNVERYQVTVWCEGEWGPIGDKIRKTGITVIQRPIRPYRPDHVLGMVRYIRKNRFDIVQSLKYGPNFMDALVCKLSRKVFISSRRNIRHWSGALKMHVGERLRNLMTDHIIANSESVKDLTIVVEHVPATKITVIYNGVDLEEVDAAMQKSDKTFRSSLAIPFGAIIVGNLANLREVKGQSYLVKAFADVVGKTDKDVYLVIHGEGPEETNLRALVKELKIEDRVRFSTSPRDRFEVMHSFDVFVLPSLGEGFSNALLEAMALSLPCIVSDVGGNPEAVVHNVSGLIVPVKAVEPLAEAILRLVDDPALAKEFGVKARELVERQYTVQRMVSAHERLYEELLKGD